MQTDIILIKASPDNKEIKYDQNLYNKNFMEKNKEKITSKQICPICKGKYTYYNKSTHFKSKKHIMIGLLADQAKLRALTAVPSME